MKGSIPFNKPYLSGNEMQYINQAVNSGKLSGNGLFTLKCHDFFKNRYGLNKCLLTTSCTDALEMAAILLNISPGDEVIMPSYTFVSTALAFIRQGAKVVFVDSSHDNPNIDVSKIEEKISSRTKAIVPVHYAGVSCDMNKIMDLSNKYNIFVVEDAAQAIDSFYNGKALGSIGHISAFSFHETKNIISGEGGMLCVNDSQFFSRADIIWEKGTNRSAFFRGEVDKYSWVDIGSSFLPSEIIAAFLYAQFENIDKIQERRISIWSQYYNLLKKGEDKGAFKLPFIPDFATNNGHMFYLVLNSLEDRNRLIRKLKEKGILAVSHYLSLNKSKFYLSSNDLYHLNQSDRYTDCLLRLPLFYELEDQQVEKIANIINSEL